MLLGPRLTGLTADLLANVADALALVRLRRPHRTELSGYLAHQFLVRALDLDRGVVVDRYLDPLRRLVLDRMRVANDQVHPIGFSLGLVAYALNFESLAE